MWIVPLLIAVGFGGIIVLLVLAEKMDSKLNNTLSGGGIGRRWAWLGNPLIRRAKPARKKRLPREVQILTRTLIKINTDSEVVLWKLVYMKKSASSSRA